MLPAEASDVLAFLNYFELAAAKLANSLCFNVALKTTGHLRTFDFSEFIFEVFSRKLDIRRRVTNGYNFLVCSVEFTNADAGAQFVTEAFRNCFLGGIEVYCSGQVLNVLRDVANGVIIVGSLFVFGEGPRLTFQDMRRLDEFMHLLK